MKKRLFHLACIAAAASLCLPGVVTSAPATMPPLDGATGWINSAPLTPQALNGKVVLVDFWTYSCINCLRTLPYVRAWARKYQAAGLVVVGVHTPEFEFEQQPGNVLRAVRDLDIGYPVALDSHYTIWRAFGNRAWPALYFVDAQGRIRHSQYGEGRYADAERLIQQLLREAGRGDLTATGLVAPVGKGTQAAANPEQAESDETYIGSARASGFVSTHGGLRPGDQVYAGAPSLHANQWTLSGAWRVGEEYALGRQPGGRIAYRFRARDLHLVMASDSGHPIRFRVRIDGRAPGADHGTDTNADGRGIVDAQRLYQLVRQAASAGERTFEIEFLDAGVRVYAFTFG
ncbi:thioredoxin family protein [Eleftheria terrae]|uniref:thioredoxin family protein n=1 Tax=Eleftheria terrae TaxID=1597781 RepID=UPI00344137EF